VAYGGVGGGEQGMALVTKERMVIEEEKTLKFNIQILKAAGGELPNGKPALAPEGNDALEALLVLANQACCQESGWSS
jgi:hypothetical protein